MSDHDMSSCTRQAFLNGEWILEHDLAIGVNDIGFALGVTVTERLRTFGGQIFRLDQHLQRMASSLQIVGLDAPAIVRQLEQAIGDYRNRHAAQIADGDDWAIVAFATPGDGREPTTVVHGFPLPFASWAAEFDIGVPVYTSDHRQVPPNCWPAELKCRSRMHYYLADQQARKHNPRARAILLDQLGFVGEASTANLVVYRRGEGLLTPCFDRVLPGVSVAVVEELAADLGIPFTQRDITLDELRSADEVWLSSTSICVLPVVECDGQPIADGTPGDVYRKLLAAWGALVGIDIAEQAKRLASRK
jgi:branched-subunit amino acid aminotransferase/4-amino-4-deoxychorismate lyase